LASLAWIADDLTRTGTKRHFAKCIEINLVEAAGRADPRPVPAERNRDVLVDRAGRGALRVELWIVAISLGKRLFKGIGREDLLRSAWRYERGSGGDQKSRQRKWRARAPRLHYATPLTQHTHASRHQYA